MEKIGIKILKYLMVISILCSSITISVGSIINAAQIDLITNGGFTSGSSPWILSGNFQADSRFSYYHDGPGYAYLSDSAGQPANNLYGTLYQQVTIPTSVTSANLSFWYNITSTDTGNTPYDSLSVTIQNTSGTILYSVAFFTNLDKQSLGSYAQKTCNLSSYIGQTIRIFFQGYTNGSYPTVFRIDDVSVLATTTLPDLIVEDVQVTPDPPVPGSSTTTMTLKIKNQGNANAVGTFNLDLPDFLVKNIHHRKMRLEIVAKAN
jgi:hypothetical protein